MFENGSALVAVQNCQNKSIKSCSLFFLSSLVVLLYIFILVSRHSYFSGPKNKKEKKKRVLTAKSAQMFIDHLFKNIA